MSTDTAEDGSVSTDTAEDGSVSTDTAEDGSMSTDTAEEPQSPTFLDSIEFLTGEDPSAGSFLLVVGIVTCVFIAVFQFTLPAPISLLLTGLVIVVAVISFIMGAILDALGYFDTEPIEA